MQIRIHITAGTVRYRFDNGTDFQIRQSKVFTASCVMEPDLKLPGLVGSGPKTGSIFLTFTCTD
jgi:hypothetical protein